MKDSFLWKFTAAQLRRAADLRDKLEAIEREATGRMGIPEQLTVGHMLRTRRKLSAATRRKISLATKARWAKIKAGRKG